MALARVVKDDYDTPIMANVFLHEGGYGWKKRDPGGPTKWGITYIDLAEFEKKPIGSPAAWAPLVEAMPQSTADTIFRTKYAGGVLFDYLVKGPDYVMLDYAINSGIERAVRVAQTLTRRPVSGRMGPSTVDAINSVPPDWFIDSMSAERRKFLQGLATWDEFGSGWDKRVSDVQRIAHELASGVAPVHTSKPTTADAGQKGVHAPSPATQGTIVGGMAAGATTIAATTASHFPIGVALATGAAVIIGGAVIWVRYHKQLTVKNQTIVLPPGVVPRAG